jgi:hypothetical protein
MFLFVRKEKYFFPNIKFISAFLTLPRERKKMKEVNQYILLQIQISVNL